MAVTTTTTGARSVMPGIPDVGCRYAARCIACPWRVCVEDLPPEERIPFAQAFRLLARYVAEPDPATR